MKRRIWTSVGVIVILSSCGREAARRASTSAEETEDLGASSAARSLASGSPIAGLEDFLVQNVCASIALPERVINADPYACPSGYRARDLRAGEVLPYTKSDQPQANRPYGFQTADSIPLSFSGTRRHVHLFDFGVDDDYLSDANLGGHGMDGRDISARFEHNYVMGGRHRDGSDVSEYGGAFTSLVATTDTSGVQPFWGPNCATEDGWLLFPSDLRRGDLGRSALTALSGGANCTSANYFQPTITYFDYPNEPLGYSSGKVMESIVSWHFDATSILASHHIEKFFFTRQYGKTRWERWEAVGRSTACGGRLCTADDAHIGTCSGPVLDEREGGPTFVRTDCRDWTNILAHPQLGFDPYTVVAPVGHVDANLLDNGDFGRGLGDIGAWRMIEGSGNWQILSEKSAHPLIHGNHYLIVAPVSRAVEVSVYQDVVLPIAHIGPGPVAYRTGFRLWSPDGAASGQRAALVVFAFGSDGRVLRSEVVQVARATDYPGALIRSRFTAPAGTRRVRYQIYFACESVCARTSIDGAYFTRE